MKSIFFTFLLIITLSVSSISFAAESENYYTNQVHTEEEILAMLPEGAEIAFTGPIVRNYNDCVKGVSDTRIQALSPRTIPQCNCTLDYVVYVMIPNKQTYTSLINRTMIHRPEQCRVDNPTKITASDSVVKEEKQGQ